MIVTETSTQRPEDWPYACPECDEDFVAPELLGSHLERHREVGFPMFSKTGKPQTKPCPRGCGRHFRTKGGGWQRTEMNEHVPLCDGSEPIPPLAIPAQVKIA